MYPTGGEGGYIVFFFGGGGSTHDTMISGTRFLARPVQRLTTSRTNIGTINLGAKLFGHFSRNVGNFGLFSGIIIFFGSQKNYMYP